ncbi:MAG: hypothetical protein ACKOWW_00265 [Flavobacteriales bacterium]
MKKGLFLVGLLTSLQLSAQNYVHQVLVVNEGYFDYQTNQILTPVTIGSYNPSNQQYAVVDTLENMRFASDLVIDGAFYYVAADSKIFKFDLNTHQELASVSCPGVRNLAIANNRLIATRGEYLQTYNSYLHVYDKSNLQLTAALDTIAGPKWACQNLVVVGNTAYVAVNNAYEWGNEKGLIGQLDINTLQYGNEIDLGPEGKNPDNMFLFNNELITVNNKDWSSASVSKVSLNGVVNTQNLANAVTGCGTSALRDDKLVYQLSMENTLHDYNLINMSWLGPVNGITENFYDLAQDPISGNLYASSTDFFSTGKVFVFAPDNTELDQFDSGVSTGTIVFDVRSSAGLTDLTSNVSVAPNPSQDIIQISGLAQNTPYFIADATGKILLEGNHPVVSLQNLAAGVYYLHVNQQTVKISKH